MAKKVNTHLQTMLCQPGFQKADFKSLATAIQRASTVVYDTVEQLRQRDWKDQTQYTYGLLGTPTTRRLAEQLANIDGVKHCLLTSSGLSAISLVMLTFLERGDTVYLPSNAYYPALEVARHLEERLGVELKIYNPTQLADLVLANNTKLVWVETPGSVTMEITDLPYIAKQAHAVGALVAVDATWAAGIALPAFQLGADISIQALTKYQSGGSDVMMGGITTNEQSYFDALWKTNVTLGMGVSPADCEIILRSLPHMQIRYKTQDASARIIAEWCEMQPCIEAVLHPALPNSAGHAIWQRDFTGAASLFSIVFKSCVSQSDIDQAVNALSLFHIGFSWGGAVSLAIPFTKEELHADYPYSGGLVRLYIGLEHTSDLIDDLKRVLSNINASVKMD